MMMMMMMMMMMIIMMMMVGWGRGVGWWVLIYLTYRVCQNQCDCL